MPFRKLERPKHNPAYHRPLVTLSRATTTGQVSLTINQTARRMLGAPTAVVFYWDADECILRIQAASPDDPASYSLSNSNHRISVTGLLRDLGIDVTATTRCAVTRSGHTSIDADLSDMPTTGLQTIPERAA